MSQPVTAAASVPVDSSRVDRYPPSMLPHAEAILIDQARNGDERSFARLVEAHGALVLQLAWRLVGDRDEADDLSQEVFLRLHRGLGRFRGDSRLSTWLYRTTTHLAIDHLRRRRLRQRLFLGRREEPDAEPYAQIPCPSPNPAQALEQREWLGRLGRALERLSARQRAVFILRHYEELPLKEIAALLDLEEGTVKSHLHRAVTVLRKEFKHEREVP